MRMQIGRFLKRSSVLEQTLLSGFIGLFGAGIIMLIFGYNPISAYSALFKGAFGDLYGFSESLANATPLILTALTFAIGFRGGMFNIGAEGQVYIGALAAVSVSAMNIPAGLNFVLAILFAALAGALWALPVAVLKVCRGVHEVISTIMFNWIAHFLAFYLIANVLVDPLRAEKTISVVSGARFPLLVRGTSLGYGILLSVFIAGIIFLVLWRTVIGFRIRVTGYNLRAATYAGINKTKMILFAFMLGGVTAGLAGAVHVMGRPPTYALYSGLPAIMNLGFNGLAVSMIGRNHPIGIIAAGIFFGGLLAGGRMMQFWAHVPLEMVYVVEGIIVFSLAVPELVRVCSSLKRSIPFITRLGLRKGEEQ